MLVVPQSCFGALLLRFFVIYVFGSLRNCRSSIFTVQKQKWTRLRTFNFLLYLVSNLCENNYFSVITGSTDGIGKAYAFELARKGFDLVLISRTQSKLDSTANEIREKYSTVTIKTIAFDFTTASLQEYESHLFSALGQLEVGVLGKCLFGMLNFLLY